MKRQITTNLTGLIHLIRAGLPHLRAQGAAGALHEARPLTAVGSNADALIADPGDLHRNALEPLARMRATSATLLRASTSASDCGGRIHSGPQGSAAAGP